jgi:hypothetical protein
MRVIRTSWAHVWRLRSLFLGTGYDTIDQNNDESYNLVSIHPWKLFFDGSACKEGQCVGIVLISPRGAVFEQSVHSEYFCTNNQAEYEAILLAL